MKRIGFIGLGDMGLAMAKNLLAGGFDVKGFDLREQRLVELESAGGKRADSPGEVGRDADTVFVMVLNGDQVRTIVCGENGLAQSMRPESTVIVSATIHAPEMKEIAQSLAERDIRVIDSPVSGGRAGAEAGTLTMMAAAPKAVFDQHRDVLNAVGREIIHVGEEIGMGQTVKASLQALIGTIFAGTYESLVLAAKSGVKGEVFHRVVSTTGASCGIFDGSAKAVMDRRFKGTGSQITTMNKDLGITMDAAKRHGVAMFAASAAHELFQAGIGLFPDEDNQCVAKFLEQIAGTEVTW